MLFVVDFDGTISLKDTLDALLEKFADPSWEELEQEWLDGKITGMECMARQVDKVRATPQALEEFFCDIKLDATFLPFYQHVSQFATVVIGSDGLDHAIEVSTKNAGWPAIPIYSNHLSYTPEGIKMTFPRSKPDCKGGNGMCKCAVAKNLSAKSGGPIVLIGDGKSDACISNMADIVFAKGSLVKHCEKNNIAHHKFETFADVLAIIKEWSNEDHLTAAYA